MRNELFIFFKIIMAIFGAAFLFALGMTYFQKTILKDEYKNCQCYNEGPNERIFAMED